MKWNLLATVAATALLAAAGGGALAQGMTGGGGYDQQHMNQQMQNIQDRQQERHRDQKTEQNGPDQQNGAQSEHRAMGSGMQQGERMRTSTTKTLTTEQKTRIRTTVIERPDAPRIANVNFTVRVGVAVPRTVRVVPVPQEIIAIYPEYAGYEYFIDGDDQIVFIDPGSFTIVGTVFI